MDVADRSGVCLRLLFPLWIWVQAHATIALHFSSFHTQRQALGLGSAEDKSNSATASKLSEVIEKSPDQPTAASSAAKGPSALDDLLGLEGSFTGDRPPQANPWGTAAPQPTVSSNPFQPVNTVSFPNSSTDPWSQTSSGKAVSDHL